uniref:Uncharacterized protein n=1 Tax=Siphoviridae sp. ctFiA6 TaxID=2823573 RepID=A0A8S5LG82_9CAUD|nr:MAG TPA: hypothetical protein [Siphoviridae sp. ctFiA6]
MYLLGRLCKLLIYLTMLFYSIIRGMSSVFTLFLELFFYCF